MNSSHSTIRHPSLPKTNGVHDMKFTDIFIRRPVLAVVISLLVSGLGTSFH